jgi:hypothetical protein
MEGWGREWILWRESHQNESEEGAERSHHSLGREQEQSKPSWSQGMMNEKIS